MGFRDLIAFFNRPVRWTLLTGLAILTPQGVYAGTAACPGNTFFWVATAAASWSTANKWANTSNGATQCTNVPFSSATVVFDGAGGGGGNNGNCTIDVAVTVSSFTISGYTGVISTNTANGITITKN